MGLYAERIFPWMIDRGLDTPGINARRARLLAEARGATLEIGFGTGVTLPFYDFGKVTALTVVEPSTGMNRLAARRIAAAGAPVEVVAGGGERLPFADARFDTVVTSLTLCSVDDPAAVLAEIRRVLKPGGRFLFLEHVRSDDPARARLTPLQKVIGVGCHLDRPTAEWVRAAGFELPAVAQQIEPSMPFAPLVPLVEGVAIRP
jgi:SAM-dependent methyltransferase